MVLSKVTVQEYDLNEKNSIKAEQPTRLDPGCPGEIAINIKSIVVEMTIKQYKKLKVGQDLEFDIEQELEFSVPNYKNKEYDDLNISVSGKGFGEIKSIESLLNLDCYDDEELEEIEIELLCGYAEGLV